MPLPNFIKVASEGKGLRGAKIRVRLWVTEGVAKAGAEPCSYQKVIRLRGTFPPAQRWSRVNSVKCLSAPLWTSSTHIDDQCGETVLTK